MYITDARSLIILQHVDRLRWVLVSKRFLRDITIKAYDYEFLKMSNESALPINSKIRSLLNLILSPIITSQIVSGAALLNSPGNNSVWGFVKSISIQLTDTSLPLDAHVSYDWLQVLMNRMQQISSLRLLGFTWNSMLINLIKHSCTRKIKSLDLEILLIQEEDVDWNDLFYDFCTNALTCVDHLAFSSSSECINPNILLKLLELKFWKSLCMIWKAEVDSGIFQLLLSKLLSWIRCHPNLEYFKLEVFLPRMMENVTIPISSLKRERYNIRASVDPLTKKFFFLMALDKAQSYRQSLCLSSTSTLIPNESCWTDESGCGIF